MISYVFKDTSEKDFELSFDTENKFIILSDTMSSIQFYSAMKEAWFHLDELIRLEWPITWTKDDNIFLAGWTVDGLIEACLVEFLNDRVATVDVIADGSDPAG